MATVATDRCGCVGITGINGKSALQVEGLLCIAMTSVLSLFRIGIRKRKNEPQKGVFSVLPRHIAIIMDGNGRWAKKRSLPRVLGHREGAETLKRITRYCKNIGVGYLTVYAFSTENWKRSPDEVSGIMDLLRSYLETFEKDPENDKIRVRFIGDRDGLDQGIVKEFDRITERTRDNRDAIDLIIAFNYGGRRDIVNAAKGIAKGAVSGDINVDDIDEELFSGFLYTEGIPDPDLLIKPGAEKRISNFLLWQLAYTEMWFTDVLWPDFGEKEIDEAILEFGNRQRRFGGLAFEGQNS